MNLFSYAIQMFKKWEHLLFPYLCVMCCRLSDVKRDLCASCEERLPKLGVVCNVCGNQLTTDSPSISMTCGACLKSPPAYDAILPLFEYIEPIDRLILRLKFGKKLVYARLLGELMADRLAQRYEHSFLPDCILPVPLHIKRLQMRGFNQSLELARPISKRLGIPIEPFLYKRIKNTEQQSSLSLEQRQSNVHKAFFKQGKKRYQRIAILDDVVTTGFTVASLSQTLKSDGVGEVVVWCCARTCF